MPGTIAHYRLESEIGRGGTGVVSRATDTRDGREVALKVLPAGITSDTERARRFVQDARAAAALNHPNIITIHEIDSERDVTFMAMDLVDGRLLDQMMAEGQLRLDHALD